MKKYGILAVATILAIAGILAAGSFTKQPATEVTAFVLEAAPVEKKVVCSGNIETADSKSLYVDVSCIAGEIYVQTGQKVRKGDVLFSVDIEATKQVLAAMGGDAAANVDVSKLSKEVVSPVNGVLTTLNVKSGAVTDSSKPCAVISSSDMLQVKVSIHEKDIKNIAVGQKVRISGTALKKESYTGTISEIASSARQQYVGSVAETVVDAVVLLDSAGLDDSLRLGLTARADVIVNTIPDALVVPYDCVLQDEDNREYVYIVVDGMAVKRIVVTGDELSNGYRIAEGLKAGDQIIREPDVIKKDGDPVRVVGKGI